MDLIHLSLPLIMGAADRWCGGGLGWKSSYPGRPIYYAAILLPGFFLIHLGWVYLFWLMWRSLSWNLFGGAFDPKNLDQVKGLFAHHLLLVVGLLWASDLQHGPSPLYLGISLFGGLIFALTAACSSALLNPWPKANPYLEVGRGVLFGALMMWL